MSKHAKKKPVRGSGFSVDLPTEPLAGEAKTAVIMAVIIPEAALPDVDIRLGDTREFRVGGKMEAFMERVGPAPDSEFRIVTNDDNAEDITVEFQHALRRTAERWSYLPGAYLKLNPVSFPSLEDYCTELGVTKMGVHRQTGRQAA